MEENRKLFEVILAPSDRLEKELEEVLGGMGSCNEDGCTTNSGNCNVNMCSRNGQDWCDNNTCSCNKIVCPPGYILGPDGCHCIPAPEQEAF